MSKYAISRRTLLAWLGVILAKGRAAANTTSAMRWAVDYGSATDPVAARSYKLLVLEPDHARPIARLRGPGSILLGYVSLGEVERRRPYFSQLEKAGALRAVNPNWPDARMADLRHAVWRSVLLDKIIPEILRKGYDGIFMDTLDNAEAMEAQDPKANAGMVAAASDVVHAIRTKFPSIKIMMNRGYALLPRTAKDIDALLGEAMASRWSFADRRYEMTTPADWTWQAERLRAAKKANPALDLMTLDYWDPADARTVKKLYEQERAAGFHPYVAVLALDHLLAEPNS
jgi:uncharacterized protein (TIGR01370 family)